jgi:predicted metal-dependent enzyme (double-stranded beta helix superfamily)
MGRGSSMYTRHPVLKRKLNKKAFLNSDLTPLLPKTGTELLLEGDFNCILNAVDSTGHNDFSKGIVTILKGFGLHGVWDASRTQLGYTYYVPMKA